ncbi:hypothetical protein FSST1_007555 [Fusarium sambucinum]
MATSGASAGPPTQGPIPRAAVVLQNWGHPVGSDLPANLPTFSVKRGDRLWVFSWRNNYGLASRRIGDKDIRV